MIRITALEQVSNRKPLNVEIPYGKISEYFGVQTFSDSAMREYLTREAYSKVKDAINKGDKIDRKIADQIAASMKAWAIIRIGFTRLQAPLPKSTTHLSTRLMVEEPSKISRGLNLFNRNQMLPVFQVVESATPSKPAVTQPGTQHHLLSS